MSSSWCMCVCDSASSNAAPQGAARGGEHMAWDESSSSQGRRSVDPEDPWADTVARTGTESAETSPPEYPPPPKGESRRPRVPSRRLRYAAALTLPLLALVLARVISPGALGGDTAGRRAAPSNRPAHRSAGAHLPQADRRASVTGHVATARRRASAHLPAQKRVRRHHAARRGIGHTAGQPRKREPPPEPTPPALSSVPSEESAPSEPAPESALGSAERAPGAEGPGGGAGLKDGSHGSAEFGL